MVTHFDILASSLIDSSIVIPIMTFEISIRAAIFWFAWCCLRYALLFYSLKRISR